MPNNSLKPLPPKGELETPAVLRKLVSAHRCLAELKGVAKTIPNEGILISTLALQEAQSSSEIENMITTQDKLYKHQLQPEAYDPITKEVAHYADALSYGYGQVREYKALSLNHLIEIQAVLEGNNAGFRKMPGTVLKNERTGEVVFEPPSPDKIMGYMADLEQFINAPSSLDPLVRMALLHHQFETIHPFYDGNGRTGRILNILYLVLTGLLDMPILYLSRYINQSKGDYYRLLQSTRETQNWEPWIIYMLDGVAQTAKHTSALIEAIRDLLASQKHLIRSEYKFYSQDLMNNLFSHPYTKVAFLEADLRVSRATATRYLDALANGGILEKQRLGKESYYINTALVELLFNMKGFSE